VGSHAIPWPGRTQGLVERNCHLAKHFAEGLQRAGFEVLNEVVLNQVLVSFGDTDQTQRVISEVQNDGTCWCGGTQWRGRAAMRISISSWETTEEDIESSLAAILRIANSVTNQKSRENADRFD
jgi:glutamate/tyrosine decarboxylase-like PLP-dependent enzyme